MNQTDFDKEQGHWILASMGKKVLRPGGRELTKKLVNSLRITRSDHVVEFAPGLGFTATQALTKRPQSYVGVDADQQAITYLKQKITGPNVDFILGNAATTMLPDESKNKVFGEAMLTMQADHRKSAIIKEAHRILKKGGLYAIHEMGLSPDTITEETKSAIQRDLALAVKVNARPLTESEWKCLLEKEGFRVKKIKTNAMHLLEPKRIIADEGLLRTLKIGFNMLRTPKARRRILAMRRTFRKHQQHINALVIVAEKI